MKFKAFIDEASKIIYYSIIGKSSYLSGDTFPIKDTISKLGFKWDGMERAWVQGISDKKELEKKLVELARTGYSIQPRNSDGDYVIKQFSSTKGPEIPKSNGEKIIYARAYPYGAPFIHLRGAGTTKVKDLLKHYKFEYDSSLHAFTTVYFKEEIEELFKILTDHGYKIIPKSDQKDKGYVIKGYET